MSPTPAAPPHSTDGRWGLEHPLLLHQDLLTTPRREASARIFQQNLEDTRKLLEESSSTAEIKTCMSKYLPGNEQPPGEYPTRSELLNGVEQEGLKGLYIALVGLVDGVNR